MSRARIRPAREETRQRLFRAAADMFAEYGVGAVTIEQITSAAGFSRGAFYSNFDSKDELLIAMLEDHVQRTVARNLGLLSENSDPTSFVEALRDNLGRGDDPLHESPLLEIELMLHVARRPELRPALTERLSAMRTLVGEIAASTLRAAGVEHDIDTQRLGTLLVATEDGLRLHRLVDPETTPADAFLDALDTLQELVVGTNTLHTTHP